jgi:von Hippel-Lindau disease tumor supressor
MKNSLPNMSLPYVLGYDGKMAEDSGITDSDLKSKHSRDQSFVRFINNTDRVVDVIWINFEGQHVKYKTLPPSAFFDCNTYVTHPWMFFDSETHDKLVVKCEEVFRPEPWYVQYQHAHAEGLPMKPKRTLVYITIPIYTLRERSLQAVRNNLSQPEDAFKLKLPNTLQRELAAMVKESVETKIIAS